MTKNVRSWINGFVGAAINSAANSITVMIVDPEKFNLKSGLGNLGSVVLVSIIFGASLYLKQHPVPVLEEEDSKIVKTNFKDESAPKDKV